METKACSRCQIVKTAEAFGFQKRQNGRRYLRSICKACAVAKTQEWTARNPEKRKANWRSSAENRRELHNQECRQYVKRHSDRRRASMQAYWDRNPGKREARHAVAYALLTGKLEKKPCEKCGSVKRVHAHHHDYSKPLDVTWLCPGCHGKEHCAA